MKQINFVKVIGTWNISKKTKQFLLNSTNSETIFFFFLVNVLLCLIIPDRRFLFYHEIVGGQKFARLFQAKVVFFSVSFL